MKFVVAVTGILLTGFVVFHMLGNLQVFQGPAKVNAYAKFLKDLGPLLWVARIGLLVILVAHVVMAVRLKRRSAAARPIAYVHEETIQASAASRYMLLTGLMILAFIIYHVAHFTLGVVVAGPGGVSYLDMRDPADPSRHDVYRMMIAGFSSPMISLSYLVAQVFLFLHLLHGVSSVFQTLGVNSPRAQSCITCLGRAVASLVFVGNVSIVAAVWLGVVR